MKQFIFRIRDGRALLAEGDSLPTDRAKVFLEGGEEGILILGKKQLSLDKEGAMLCADQFPCDVYTPAFFVQGKRFEGPPLSVGGGYFAFLPPTHAQLCRLEERLRALEAAQAELEKRIGQMEAHMQDTTIF